ncbi:MAG: GNAT family N-acetyltransferase [Myxococcales bacterium]|nr:GNAT family N-acetyltransferase [Myxococcales bacterium]MDD9970360.1 GNAT family N-acetyltransferase [Myxococcales bacterium]
MPLSPLETSPSPRQRAEQHGSARSPRLELITSEAGFRQLQPAWNRLLRLTPDWTPFQLFELQALWWQTFGADSELFIVVLYRDTEVRAIAPMRVSSQTYLGQPRRLLTYIGDRREIDRPTVLREGEDPEALRLVFGFLLARQADWDALHLYDLGKESVAYTIATQVLRTSQLLSATRDVPVSPWVDTTGDWDAFLKTKSRVFRKTLRRRRRQLAQQGQVRFTTHQTHPEVAEAFATFRRVEGHSWKREQGLDLGREPAYLAYHSKLVDELGPLGKVVFRVLWLDDQPIAASFGLVEGEQFVALHITHDDRFKRFSPGVVLTAHELEACYTDQTCRIYDFLGGHLNNKLAWEPNLRKTVDLFAFRKEPVFRIVFAWRYRFRPKLRGHMQRLGVHGAYRRARAKWFGTPEPDPEA